MSSDFWFVIAGLSGGGAMFALWFAALWPVVTSPVVQHDG